MPYTAQLSKCNTAQKEAILFCHSNGPLLILAGAGTGKTTVLSLRIAHLINSGVSGDQILALTFTQKAAHEMAERTYKVIAKGAEPHCTTFHALAYKVLKEAVEGEKNYIRMGFCKEPKILMSEDFERFSQYVEMNTEGVTSEELHKLNESVFEAPSHELQETPLYDMYNNWCKREGLISFEGMIMGVVALLKSNPSILNHYRNRFSHLLIDEYQDVNPLQYHLSRLLIGERTSLFVVGDDDQAIYGFRGADIQNILNFRSDYPSAKIIKLEYNYRSAQPIISLANRVFSDKEPLYRKKLIAKAFFESSLFKAGLPVMRIDSKSGLVEVQTIVALLQSMQKEYKTRYDECALLVRLNSQVEYYRTGLQYWGVETKEGKEEEGDRVIIQTIHASKGLQYPVVFYCGVSEELCPLKQSGGDPLRHEAEERRLFYVAITRAEARLFVLHTKKRVFNTKNKAFKPSRFMNYVKEPLWAIAARLIRYYSR